MNLASLVSPADAAELGESIRSAVGCDAVYALTYDLLALRPVVGAQEEIDDDDLIASILSGEQHRRNGSIFVAVPTRDFPLVVVRYDGPVPEIDPADRRLIGMIFEHHSEVFDEFVLARRRQSMSAAARLQWDQLKVRAATLGGFKVAATIEPAYDVAGDLFDMAIAPNGAVTVYCLDAMGHGQAATMSAALALAAARTARRSGASLDGQVRAADDAIANEFGGHRFVTMVAVEAHDDEICVVNAGHEPMRRATKERIELIEIHADPPLGIDSPKSFTTTRLAPLAADEFLYLITDGIREARSLDGVALGKPGTERSLGEAWSGAPLLLAQRLMRAVKTHAGGHLLDDATIVVIRPIGTI